MLYTVLCLGTDVHTVYCEYIAFFFSSRRRHTRCALVTGVQTCALPIFCSAVARTSALASWPVTRTVGICALIARASEELIRPRPMIATREKGSISDQIGRASCRERVCQYV